MNQHEVVTLATLVMMVATAIVVVLLTKETLKKIVEVSEKHEERINNHDTRLAVIETRCHYVTHNQEGTC